MGNLCWVRNLCGLDILGRPYGRVARRPGRRLAHETREYPGDWCARLFIGATERVHILQCRCRIDTLPDRPVIVHQLLGLDRVLLRLPSGIIVVPLD